MDEEQRCHAELRDAALVHSVHTEISDAAAALHQHPLDEGAADRMRHALAGRMRSAQRALNRLQTQDPPPGAVSSAPGLRVVTDDHRPGAGGGR